jgi:3-deoxy-D-manno-octulosonic acid kinase
MKEDSGLRIATTRGAMLANPLSLGTLLESCGEALFDSAFWAERGEITAAGSGRGSAWFVRFGARDWVLRHYRRGGFIAHLSSDRYLWAGEPRVRAFAEYRLLARLSGSGLAVPRPIGARYRRTGLCYRCDLLTERVEGAAPLSGELAKGALGDDAWRSIGAAIARLHEASVDHADLNAHNLLLDRSGAVSIIDFDRGRVRAGGWWKRGNLERLHRSLEKVTRGLPPQRFSARAWSCLLAGYDDGLA